MSEKNYEILSGSTLVALWENNNLTVKNEALLPLYLRKIHNADMWLETRAIDSHRANSRLLKKALRLAEKDDVSTVIHVNGATITDNYWIRPIGSGLTYDDVKFTDDYFSGLALKGNYDSFNRAANSKRSKTPELTNVGSFEKCWKLRDGKWWMYKKASHKNVITIGEDGYFKYVNKDEKTMVEFTKDGFTIQDKNENTIVSSAPEGGEAMIVINGNLKVKK